MHAMPEADQGALGAKIAARLDELAAISDEPERLTRLYLGPGHRKAADLVSRWMRDAGMAVRIDSTGNVVGRYRGQDPGPRTLMLGSHIDSVRDAGRFDGTLGVITAIEVVAAAAKVGKRYPFAIEVIAFGDEEGVRFPSTLSGSKALAGRFDRKALDEVGEDGVSRRQALLAFGCDPLRLSEEALSPEHALGYVEVHIEQGPVLEQEGLPVGIVTAIDGVTRGTVDVEGVAGHAGTVPMAMRKDALSAAAEMMLAIEERGRDRPNLVATVGKIDVRASRSTFAVPPIRNGSPRSTTSRNASLPSPAGAASAPIFPSAMKCRPRYAIKIFRAIWRPPSNRLASRSAGCRAAPATTRWLSTGSFRSRCCSCAAAAASVTIPPSLPRRTISTLPHECSVLF